MARTAGGDVSVGRSWRGAALLVAAFLAGCGDDAPSETDGPDAAAAAACQEHAEAAGSCGDAEAERECIACHRECGEPCRYHASCPASGFVCD